MIKVKIIFAAIILLVAFTTIDAQQNIQKVLDQNQFLLLQMRCNNLAILLAQVSNTLDAGDPPQKVRIEQVNQVLINNGYSSLIRDLEAEEAAAEEEMMESLEEAVPDKTKQKISYD